ncbi:hypothetical protein ACFW1M_16475, partial [Streptomyces inhibens]
MKLASLTVDGVRRAGAVDEAGLAVALLPASAGTVDDIVRGGPAALDAARTMLAGADTLPLSEVRLESPLHRFNRDILCTGWNYWDHFEESKGKREGQDPPPPPPHTPKNNQRAHPPTPPPPRTPPHPPPGSVRHN